MDQAELEQKLTDVETQLTGAVAKVETLEAIDKAYRELETEDRDAFATLSKEQQEEFVKADTTAERKGEILSKAKEEIEKANAEPDPEDIPEPVRKRLEEVEKRAKESEAELAEANEKIRKAEDERQTAEMVAKAKTEYANLPGTPEEIGAVLKSLHCPCIKKEQREAIEKLLTAGNEALGQVTKALGSDKTSTSGSTWEAIEKRAVAQFGEDGKVSKVDAVDAYLRTPDGEQAYNRYLEEQGKQ